MSDAKRIADLEAKLAALLDERDAPKRVEQGRELWRQYEDAHLNQPRHMDFTVTPDEFRAISEYLNQREHPMPMDAQDGALTVTIDRGSIRFLSE